MSGPFRFKTKSMDNLLASTFCTYLCFESAKIRQTGKRRAPKVSVFVGFPYQIVCMRYGFFGKTEIDT